MAEIAKSKEEKMRQRTEKKWKCKKVKKILPFAYRYHKMFV